MEIVFKALPSVGVMAVVIIVLFVVNRVLERERASVAGHQFRN